MKPIYMKRIFVVKMLPMLTVNQYNDIVFVLYYILFAVLAG